MVILVNPSRVPMNAAGEFAERWQSSLSLLAKSRDLFNLAVHSVGCPIPQQTSNVLHHANLDPLHFWRDADFNQSLSSSGVEVVYVGGSWLEEDVVIAALQAAHLGYDARVLLDLSVPRLETDRALACSRLAMHGIIPTSIRQAMLEWTVCLADSALSQLIGKLLDPR